MPGRSNAAGLLQRAARPLRMAERRRYNAAIQRVKGHARVGLGPLRNLPLPRHAPCGGRACCRPTPGWATTCNCPCCRGGNQDDCVSPLFRRRQFPRAQDARRRQDLHGMDQSVGIGHTRPTKGKGPIEGRIPLRTIAVFPSWDVMGFAVHESTGITSLQQIRKDRIPLNLSTGPHRQTQPGGYPRWPLPWPPSSRPRT